MKAILTVYLEKNVEIEIPKKCEFYFCKDEMDYTDEEWDFLEDGDFNKAIKKALKKQVDGIVCEYEVFDVDR